MRRVVQVLPYVWRVLAICAILAGVGVGLLAVTFSPLVCFDSCPTRAFYFSYLGPGTVQTMMPCVVLEVLAVAVFVAYGLATRQVRRAIVVLLVLLVGGLAGIAALAALLQHAEATLPSYSWPEGDTLMPDQLRAWDLQWSWAVTLVAGGWSGVLAYLQWRR